MTKLIKITIISLIVLVLIGGGVYGWNKYEQKISDSNQNKTEIDNTADWLTYRVEDLGISFKYPKEWGTVTLDNIWTETGKSESINFSNRPKSWILSNPSAGYSTSDATAGRDAMIWELLTFNGLYDIENCQQLADLKIFSISDCQYIQTNNHDAIVFYNGNREEEIGNRAFDSVIGYYLTGKLEYPVFGIEYTTIDEKEIQEYINTFELILKTIRNI